MPDSFQSEHNLTALRHTAVLFHDEDEVQVVSKDGRFFLLDSSLDDEGDLVFHELDFVEC